MRQSLVLAMLMFGAASCVDLSALQNGPADMAMQMAQDLEKPKDLAKRDDLTVIVPPTDMSKPPADMTPPVTWTNVTPATAPSHLLAISGYAAAMTEAIYIVGQSDTILTSADGTTFTPGATTPSNGGKDLNALWVASALDVWVADSVGNVFETPDAAVTWNNKNTGATMAQHAIFGRAGKDVLVGGDDTSKALELTPLTATSWTASTQCPQNQKIFGIWASTDTYVVVGDKNTAAKAADPSTACTKLSASGVNGTPPFTAISGTADNNIWAVTNDGQLAAADLTANTISTKVSKNNGNFVAVWVNSATEIWVADQNDKVYMSDGTTLVDKTGNLNPGGGSSLTGIWGDGTHIYVIGNKGASGFIYKH